MKEHFNSFDDIKFFHTFSYISQHVRTITLNKIQRFIQNFMPYRMIYRLPCKFVSLNFHFSRLYEYFRHLREKYTLKWKTKYTVIFKTSCPTRWYIVCFINFKFQIFVFAILRTFSLITREIYFETTNKAHNFNPLIEPVLMMCIYISFIE